MRKWDPTIDAKLKTEMCPGGAGHAVGQHFKSQCVLCRTTAHLEVQTAAPAAPTSPPEKPKKKSLF